MGRQPTQAEMQLQSAVRVLDDTLLSPTKTSLGSPHTPHTPHTSSMSLPEFSHSASNNEDTPPHAAAQAHAVSHGSSPSGEQSFWGREEAGAAAARPTTTLSEAQLTEKETRARRMNQRLEEHTSPATVDVVLWGAPDDAPKPQLVRRPSFPLSGGRCERV